MQQPRQQAHGDEHAQEEQHIAGDVAPGRFGDEGEVRGQHGVEMVGDPEAAHDGDQPAVRPRSIFRLWGGDIMYEKRFVVPVMHFLSHVLADDGAAWVAEPGRGVYEAFLQALHGGGLEGRRVFTERVEPLYAQPVPVTVAVWEIRRRVRPA